MFLFPLRATFLLTIQWAIFQQGHFLGKVLNEWIDDSQEFLHTELPKLIVIALIAFILSRFLHLLTAHMNRVAQASAAGPERMAEVKTMAGVIRATGLAIITVIAAFMSLSAIGFNLAPLLASAGIAGIAIGLAAQTIVKDMLNGFLILVEGQFSVGDTVRIAGVVGTVEALTLRRTTVRGFDGALYVIPNSQITTVANLNAGFSVATVNVSVDFSANPDAVTKLLQQIAMEVCASEAFRDAILQDPQVLGLDSVKGSEMIFPVVFRTRANQQYAPLREFQRRVRIALEENHLLPGNPYRVYQPHGDAGAASAPRSAEQASAQAHDPTTIKPIESNPFTGA
jgi:small conductance mechanosensitive channel